MLSDVLLAKIEKLYVKLYGPDVDPAPYVEYCKQHVTTTGLAQIVEEFTGAIGELGSYDDYLEALEKK